MNVHHSVVCHTEKKSDRKSEYLLPSAPGKPAAPHFLQGLSDLRVMDGSQVTMTVQVSGLSLHHSPRVYVKVGMVAGWVLLPGILLKSLTHQKISKRLSVSGPKEVEPRGPSFLLFSEWDFLNPRLTDSGKEMAMARGVRN